MSNTILLYSLLSIFAILDAVHDLLVSYFDYLTLTSTFPTTSQLFDNYVSFLIKFVVLPLVYYSGWISNYLHYLVYLSNNIYLDGSEMFFLPLLLMFFFNSSLCFSSIFISLFNSWTFTNVFFSLYLKLLHYYVNREFYSNIYAISWLIVGFIFDNSYFSYTKDFTSRMFIIYPVL